MPNGTYEGIKKISDTLPLKRLSNALQWTPGCVWDRNSYKMDDNDENEDDDENEYVDNKIRKV